MSFLIDRSIYGWSPGFDSGRVGTTLEERLYPRLQRPKLISTGAVALWPDGAILAGLINVGVIGFLVGAVFAWSHNLPYRR